MAVTGDIFKSLTFGGESSRDYGVYITGQAVYNAPERDVEMVTIPGRNGAFALDKGRFENIEVTYPAGVFANTDTEFAKAISDFRNMLCSRQGYCRLTDEYNPDEYRLAVYKSGLEVDPVQLKAGQFDITFECKPQRYLTSGEEKKVLGTWGDTETKTGEIVELENDGLLAVKSAEVSLEPQQDLHGYDKPWAGGNGKNKLGISGADATSNGVTFSVQADGTIKATGTLSGSSASAYFTASIPTGSYVFNDEIGGSSSTYWSQIVDGTNWSGVSTGGGDTNFSITTTSVRVYVATKQTPPTGGLIFKPMMRLSGTSATWQPYTNICPITGASDVDVNVRGFNQWDEETELGYINPSTGAEVASTTQLRTKNYVRVLPSTTYFFKAQAWANGAVYDANKNYISVMPYRYSSIAGCYYLDIPSNGYYIRFHFSNAYGTTYQHDVCLNFDKPTGTPKNGDYVPYNSDSDTYTTSLGTTVYGGSVDVVAGSGEMTWAGVDMGDLSWTYHSGNTCFYALVSGKKYGAQNLMCSAYKVGNGQLSVPDGEICGAGSSSYVYVSDPHYTDATTFKTAMTGQKIVYETDPIVTLSPTPTTVNLIEATNYVWSPQGDITLEYGTGPNFIVNPTLFGCGPLIEAKGYGDIQFNGHTIKLANGVIGTVNLWQQTSGGTFNGSITKTFVTGQFEPTDTFSFTVTHMFTLSEVNPSITNTNANATNSRDIGVGWEITYRIDLPCTFTVGTTGQITNTSTYDFGSGKKVISDMDVSYDSTTGTVVYTVATTTQGQPSFEGTKHGFSISECNAVSTLNRLGDPTYIDCDLGEAYKINDGKPVSLNAFVDLGSKLPELAPGINEFTVSNTFTEVAVVPRWWRI